MRKTILMLAFCGALAAMSAQVPSSGSDRRIYGNGTSTEQEDRSKMGNMPNDKSGVQTQSDKDRCVNVDKKEGKKTARHHSYKSEEPNGTTGSQSDFMSGEGKKVSYQGDHSKKTGHKVAKVKSKRSSDKTGVTTMTYTQTPLPEDHTAVSVPEKVRNAFSNAYYSMKASWKREGENYRALFKSNDKEPLETIVVYNKSGKELVIEKELRNDACPTAISKYCARNERIWEVFEKGAPMKYFIQEGGEKTKWFDKSGNRIYGAYDTHGVAHHSYTK